MSAIPKTRVGSNRTEMKPQDLESMIEAAAEFGGEPEPRADEIAAVRISYAAEGHLLGHLPGDGSDAKLALLLDKLGERLAFERTGVRLYEGVISKHIAYGGFPGGPSAEELAQHRDEELGHFHMLVEAVRSLDGDPLAVTPSADVSLTSGIGVGRVIADPRATLLQSLDALLVAELVDNDGWDALIGLAEASGRAELAAAFGNARSTEERHLADVRRWIAAANGRGG
jgi:hypothetical protein